VASASDNVDTHLRVRFLPRSDCRRQDLAVVAIADAVKQVCLDLVGAVLEGKAAGRPQVLDQVVSKIRRVKPKAHRRSIRLIGRARPDAHRFHE
jgi:hypothetical protein